MIPDTNFEQALINLGYDTPPINGSVPTASIDTLTVLNVNSQNISDLAGIEDFTALIYLNCYDNMLTIFDVSQNTALNQLWCSNNQLTALDVSQNTVLTTLDCSDNQLICLDISNNTNLTHLYCAGNLLEQLNTRNGNWVNMSVDAINNNLMCLEVDNIGIATNNWSFDGFATLSTNCNYTNPCNTTSAIEEHTTNKELLRTIDLLGRETKNKPLFYIYDDGTVEKRIVIE